jgi:hypothetical protein
MKFGPKALRFHRPFFMPFTKRLAFVGRQNTIHLQETALVVEGDLMRLRLPFFDWMVQRALAEWSMVTIPYSRIGRHTYATYIVWRVLCWLVTIPVVGLIMMPFVMMAGEADPYFLLVGVVLLVLVGVLIHLLFRPRHILRFLHADGKPRVICFYFRSRKQRLKFTELLKENRKAAGDALPAGERPADAKGAARARGR